jgi:hypothetical protein
MKFLKNKVNKNTVKMATLVVVMILATMPCAYSAGMTDFMQENTGIMRLGFAILALYCLNEILGPFFKGGEIQSPILKIVGACAGIGVSISPDTFVSLLKGWGL